MRKLLYIFLIVGMLFSCKEEEEIIFDADPADVQISFEPFEGGAYLNYVLPNNPEIYAIQAKYKDFLGKEITLKGTYLKTQLELIGFADEAKQVPVEISLIDKDDKISKSIIKHFNTKPSAAVLIFDNMTVKSYWDGFKIKYEHPNVSDAFVNIGYVGINPKTKKLDTLLIDSKPINEGENEIEFTRIKDPKIKNVDVVIWTEDFRGNDVKKKVYSKIPIARAEQFDCTDVGFYGELKEDDYLHQSWTKLFDGDKKGYNSLEQGKVWSHCFVSPKKCVKNKENPEKAVWTVDLKEEKKLAYVRIFANGPLFVVTKWGSTMSVRQASKYKVPNHVKIYGTNNPDASILECDQLGEYYQNWQLDDSRKWNAVSLDKTVKYTIEDMDFIKTIPDVYIQASFEPSEKTYRYVKVQIVECFYEVLSSGTILDSDGQVYMEELEIYTQKDNQ